MGEYRSAYAAYSRAVAMKHPNSKAIAEYAKSVALLIEPTLSREVADAELSEWYQKEFASGTEWSRKFLEKQNSIIETGGDPTEQDAYSKFYLLNGRADSA